MTVFRILIFAMCALITMPAAAAPEDSVVGLYVNRGYGQADLGTGFFTSESGQIMTAYHVVADAVSIQAVDANGRLHPDVLVEFISPPFDLAILQIASYPSDTPFLTLSDSVPSPQDSISVIGYPRGLSQQHVAARTTSPSFVSSMEFRAPSGARLFRERIDVIGIDATSYSGMSGAPVLSYGQVVGVFSGSFNEGGSIAWAIPVKYVSELSPVGSAPDAISHWPPSPMSDAFRGLQRAFSVNEAGERRLAAYVDSISELSAAANAITLSANELQAAFAMTSPVLEGARSNPTLAQNSDALKAYLEIPMELMLEKMEAYAEAYSAYSRANHGIATTLADLLNWYEQEPSITLQERYLLDQRASELDRSAANAFSYTGADENAMAQGMARLAASVSQLERGQNYEFLDTMTGMISDFGTEVSKDASAQSLMALRDRVNYYYQFASFFEVAVYRQ